MGVLTTHGMGEGSRTDQCDGCDADVRGRPTHLVRLSGQDWGWVCDWCRDFIKAAQR